MSDLLSPTEPFVQKGKEYVLEPFTIRDPTQIKLLGILGSQQNQMIQTLKELKEILAQQLWLQTPGKTVLTTGGNDVIPSKAAPTIIHQEEEWGKIHSVQIMTTTASLKGFLELDGTQIEFYGTDMATAYAAAFRAQNDWYFARYDTSNSKYTYQIDFPGGQNYNGLIRVGVQNVSSSEITITKFRLIKEIKRPGMFKFSEKPSTAEITEEGQA